MLHIGPKVPAKKKHGVHHGGFGAHHAGPRAMLGPTPGSAKGGIGAPNDAQYDGDSDAGLGGADDDSAMLGQAITRRMAGGKPC